MGLLNYQGRIIEYEDLDQYNVCVTLVPDDPRRKKINTDPLIQYCTRIQRLIETNCMHPEISELTVNFWFNDAAAATMFALKYT